MYLNYVMFNNYDSHTELDQCYQKVGGLDQ